MIRRAPALILAVILISLVGHGGEASTPAEVKLLSLTDVFAHGFGVLDGNGDGLADALGATILLPEGASPWHAAAAAELAARLGYETSALSFPVVTDDPAALGSKRLVIECGLVGDFRSEIEACCPILLDVLGANRGAVVALPSEDEMMSLAIAGYDGPGLHEAAAQFASRWPNAWEIWGEESSTLLDKLESDAEKVMSEAGLEGVSVTLQALVYERSPDEDKHPERADEEKRRALDGMIYDNGEIIAAIVRVDLNAAQIETAVAAIETLKQDHSRGRDVFTLNYPGIREVVVSIVADGETKSVSIPRFSHPARKLRRRPDPAATRGAAEVKGDDYDLSGLYSTAALFGDEYKDSIPDRIETTLALGPEAGCAGVGNLAARLGLESAGVSLPLAIVDPRPDQLEGIKQPILIGRSAATDHLVAQGKLNPPELEPGQAYIALVDNAFNGSDAVVVLGDGDGLASALEYLAERYPGISSHEPGELTVADIKERAAKLLGARNAAGQLSVLLGKVADELPQLKRRTLNGISLEVTPDLSLPGYENAVGQWLSGELGTDAEVNIVGRRDPEPIIEEEKTFEYEVDEYRKMIEEELVPLAAGGAKIAVDARLSEPPEVLAELTAYTEKALSNAGAGEVHVRLLCAYKQGFHWLREYVLPRLKEQQVASIVIRFKPETPDFDEISMFYPERTRWLSELYPIDEILAGELGLELDKIDFELVEDLEATYAVYVLDGAGNEVLSESFTPALITRKYLEKFPLWAGVPATTGWIKASVAGETKIDKQIQTDPERIWNYYQSEILSKIYDHIMKETGNKPSLDKQPFFHTLKVEAWLSEPDERVGVDEEMVSSIESLHEDIYFNSLDFFNGMVPRGGEKIPTEARYTTRTGAPGSILPFIHPGKPGEAPRAKFTFLGNHAKDNSATLRWAEGDDGKTTISLPKVEAKNVKLTGMVIGVSGIEACIVEAEMPGPEIIGLFSAGLVPMSGGSDPGAKDMLFDDPNLGEVRLALTAGDARRTLSISSHGEAVKEPELLAPVPGEQLIPTDRIIYPEESNELVRMLGTFTGFRAYRSGTSFQRRDVYSLEITAPTESTHISLAKLITDRPTIMIIGRQHANEVSSTSHILRLGELLATDPAYAEYRNKLNIVLHPTENPDGAALDRQLVEINPLHMNHAARYSALGVELGTQHTQPDTLLTEALVRTRLWARWLPDIFLNCHGYPSHEWVQSFAGYSPYQFRDYWIPRGWFVYLTSVDDPRRPDSRRAGRALPRYIDDSLTADPEMAATNKRIYERYWRWAGRWQPHVVRYELHGDTLIFADRTSSVPRKPSARSDVTVLEGITEAMDETPDSRWMEVVVAQGLAYLEAHLKLLVESKYEVEKIEEESGGRVHRTVFRHRPVLTDEEMSK